MTFRAQAPASRPKTMRFEGCQTRPKGAAQPFSQALLLPRAPIEGREAGCCQAPRGIPGRPAVGWPRSGTAPVQKKRCVYIYTHITYIYTYVYIYIYTYVYIYTSSTAQGGGGSFKNSKSIGEVGCCESRMAGRIH